MSFVSKFCWVILLHFLYSNKHFRVISKIVASVCGKHLYSFVSITTHNKKVITLSGEGYLSWHWLWSQLFPKHRNFDSWSENYISGGKYLHANNDEKNWEQVFAEILWGEFDLISLYFFFFFNVHSTQIFAAVLWQSVIN